MMNPIRFGLAVAVTASLGFANGDGVSKDGTKAPLLDNLFDSGAKVSYTPGSGMTFSAQDASAFSINISGQVQPLFSMTSSDDDAFDSNSTFGSTSTRLRFAGNVFNEDVTYFVQMDPGAATALVDGWAAWRVMDGINVRFGRQKMRSSLQADASLSDTDLELAGRSLATQTFASGRQFGLLVEGNSGNINWHVGAMNNSTASGIDGDLARANDGTDLDYTIGVNYSSDGSNTESWSEGDLAHSGSMNYIGGVNYLVGRDALTTFDPIGDGDNQHNDMETINVFAGIKTGMGVAVQAEMFSRTDTANDTDFESTGYYLQASYTLAPGEGTQWGGVIRYSEADLEVPSDLFNDDGVGTGSELSLGINAYYHKHSLKTQVMVTFEDRENADPNSDVEDATRLDILFTLMF